MQFLNSFALLIFPLGMIFAAISDAFTMKIRNNLVLAMLVGFALAYALSGLGWEPLLMHCAAGAIVLVVSFSFFAFGWIGGGDAKFAAVTALWLGFSALLPFIVYSALLGGVLTLALLIARRYPLPAKLVGVEWIDRLHNPKTGVPYGIALAIAGLIVFSSSPIFEALIG